ncbi:hypothetical protein SAMN06265222_108178 [Neorhodopirellula lusitana]|uniref:HEAT repeat domain-containing protein n=1 Tax=Neorhodopirellula lusitana TaxID=445327 RepID=A0ABY1QAC3_9BACT|nr:hypothetical protein [Neorhodopirellula lusitana]SMP64201.1 hypothetical protein SAMN06265222_108178 [Neorhodopirellula lusitana]
MFANVAKPNSLLFFIGVSLALWLAPPTGYGQRALLPTDDPAVEQTMLRAGRSPTHLGKAISALTRMNEFEKVDQLLSSIDQRGYDEGQKTQVALQITAAQRLQIVTNEKSTAQAVKTIDDLFELKAKQLASPARISQAIGALISDNPDQTLPAMRVLFAGGEASTAALAGAIAETDNRVQREYWLKALLRIDRQAGVTALKRLALYGTENLQDGAITALLRLGGSSFTTELFTALYRTDSTTSQTRDRVADALQRRGEAVPTRAAVVSMLRDELTEANRVAAESIRQFGRVDAWVMDTDRTGIRAQRIPGWMLSYRDAADAATRLIAIGDNDPQSVLIQINALLANHITNDPDWGDEKQVATFYQQNILPILSNAADTRASQEGGVSANQSTSLLVANTIQIALHRAIATNNDPAALGIVRLIHADYAPWSDWLVRPNGEVSPIVTAVDHSNPMVRYEAAAAIAALQPTGPYAGSARVRDRLIQMSQLGDRGTAVVLENRPEVVLIWERLMNQAGLAASFVSTARQLERVAATGEDIRIVISKREPKDASAVEVIDMVRRIAMTRDVPILISIDPPNVAEVFEEPKEEIERVGGVELTEKDKELAAEFAATLPDKYGVIGGIENIEGVIEKELLYGDLDIDSTTRRELDMEVVGVSRWQDQSLRAGLIRQLVRPRSVAGLYELLLDSRRRQHLPPLSPIDRVHFRQVASQALAEK